MISSEATFNPITQPSGQIFIMLCDENAYLKLTKVADLLSNKVVQNTFFLAYKKQKKELIDAFNNLLWNDPYKVDKLLIR